MLRIRRTIVRAETKWNEDRTLAVIEESSTENCYTGAIDTIQSQNERFVESQRTKWLETGRKTVTGPFSEEMDRRSRFTIVLLIFLKNDYYWEMYCARSFDEKVILEIKKISNIKNDLVF